MGDLRLSEDQRRRLAMNEGLVGPEYSGTFPPESAGTDRGAAESIDRNGPEPSMRSQDPLNGTSTARGLDLEDEEELKPRKRKGLFGNLGRKEVTEEPDDSKSLADGPRFTVASQLRATILNSWINILIVAAPVGSMLMSGTVGLAFLLADDSCSSCAVRCRRESYCHFCCQLHCYHVRLHSFHRLTLMDRRLTVYSPLAAMLSYATEEIAMRYVFEAKICMLHNH